jgi:hypothetical protein
MNESYQILKNGEMGGRNGNNYSFKPKRSKSSDFIMS